MQVETDHIKIQRFIRQNINILLWFSLNNYAIVIRVRVLCTSIPFQPH